MEVEWDYEVELAVWLTLLEPFALLSRYDLSCALKKQVLNMVLATYD